MSAYGITITEDAESVVVRISGEQFRILQRTADALNAVGWCDKDNTPATVIEGFGVGVGGGYESQFEDVDLRSWIFDIVDSIDTRTKDPDKDSKKRETIRREFVRVGLLCERENMIAGVPL